MASVFTKVIEGEFPARFVYRDDDVVAFLTINPVVPGHTLVVPVKEVEHWIDLDTETLNKLMAVSQKVGKAIAKAFPSEKVGMMIQGLEVPHVHVHLMPINTGADIDLTNSDPSPAPELLDAVQAKLIEALA
jgi:diadenosine tetraphosphate (Ap4A) HIT family hydrolase